MGTLVLEEARHAGQVSHLGAFACPSTKKGCRPGCRGRGKGGRRQELIVSLCGLNYLFGPFWAQFFVYLYRLVFGGGHELFWTSLL